MTGSSEGRKPSYLCHAETWIVTGKENCACSASLFNN